MKAIELGIQSLDGEVLKESRRFLFDRNGIECLQLVKAYVFSLGCSNHARPAGRHAGKEPFYRQTLIVQKPDMVRIYPTLVIRETDLENLYKSGQYRPLALDEAVSWCAEIVPLYEAAGIRILRLGLHQSEDIKAGAEVVAGPVHPAFGELVYSEIWRRKIAQQLDQMPEAGKSLIIHVSAPEVSRVIGLNRRNINFFRQAYGFTSIKVVGDRETGNSFLLELPG